MLPTNPFQKVPTEMSRLGDQFRNLQTGGYNALQAARG
jgi:hypothetical protein